MPYLPLPTSPDGLAVQVLLGLRRSRVQVLRASGQPVPAPVQLRGLIDTGADMTSVADSALAPLGLVPIGSVFVNTASGRTIVNRYAVSVTLLGPAAGAPGFIRHNTEVLGMAVAPVGFDVLIGMDLLAECLLIFDGRAAKFTLAF
jgi:hypothetical protein